MSEKATKIFIGCTIIAIAGVMAWGTYYYVLSPVVIGQPEGVATTTEDVGYFPSTDSPMGDGGASSYGGSGDSYGGASGGSGYVSSGNGATGGEGGSGTETTANNTVSGRGVNTVWMLTSKPIAGFAIVERTVGQSGGTMPYARFIEKGTGHIYDIAPNERTPKKITNTTNTKIFDSFWNRDGRSLIMRREGDNNRAEVIFASVKEAEKGTTTESIINSTIGRIETASLPAGVKELAVSPSGTKIFYLRQLENGSYTGTTSEFPDDNLNSKKQETILNIEIGEWQVAWPNEGLLAFTTKPSVKEPGYLFFLSLKDKRFYKVIGGINGLTANVSPSGKKILTTEIKSRQPETSVYDVEKGTFTPLTIKTLPEKCTWSTDDTVILCAVPSVIENDDYPDVWYQGLRSFDDEIWKIDAATLKTELIARKETFQSGMGIDGINLKLSVKEDYLMFTNKKDSKLWLVKIK